MQGAGGIVSAMQDVSHWASALYEGPLLAGKQRSELMTVVSDETGEPIDGPSKEHPSAFGLGVGAGFRPALGAHRYYQGMTLSYRVLYPRPQDLDSAPPVELQGGLPKIYWIYLAGAALVAAGLPITR